MTIATEITRINGNIAAAYTAANAKGATLPETENSANLATCIGSIPESTNIIPGEISNDHVYQYPSTSFEFTLPSSITKIGNNALSYVLSSCGTLTSVNLQYVTEIDISGLMGGFNKCANLTSASLSSLNTVRVNGLANTFSDCGNLTSINLSALSTIYSYGLLYAFKNCTKLETITFPNLDSLASDALYFCFSGCTKLSSISFPKIKTTSFGTNTAFSVMLDSTGNQTTHTIHFPSNLESTIQGLNGYPNFGGTSGYVTLAFDLPATS